MFVFSIEGKSKVNVPVQHPPDTVTYSSVQQFVGDALAVDHIRGDGNCFFRAISKQIYGTEDHHVDLRKETVKFMEQHLSTFRILIEGDVDEHISSMKIQKTWATVSEVSVVASMLRRDIYVVVPAGQTFKWTKIEPKISSTFNIPTSSCSCHISLINTGGYHYDRIGPACGTCNCKISRPHVQI